MSRFSKAEAEAAGWSIVHQRDEYEVEVAPGLKKTYPATIVAEKYVSLPGQPATLIHEEADSIGKLLDRINAYEAFQKSVTPETQPFEIDLTNADRTFSPLFDTDAGDHAETVIFPTDPGNLDIDAPVDTMTDEEWTARTRADTLVVKGKDGQTEQITYAGSGENAENAEELRLENKKAIEDRRAAEPAHGPTEQVEFDTVGIVDTPGIGAGGTLIVREGEGAGDVSERKEALKKMREEGRVGSQIATGFQAIAPEGADKLAGTDVGIQERGDLGSEIPGAGMIAPILDEPENDQEENVAPHLYPEGTLPDEGVVEEDENDDGEDAEEAAAKKARDEDGDEDIEKIKEAQASGELPVDELDVPDDEDEPEASTPAATPAAERKAEELGIDIATVEGTGKNGKVTASDVEAAAPDAE